LSLQKFRQLYTNIKVNDSVIEGLDKLKLYSIRKNHSDFTFYCKKIIFYKNELFLQHPILDTIRNFFEKHESSIHEKLNKKLLIFHESPYDLKINEERYYIDTEINCRYDSTQKEILFTNIRHLTIELDGVNLSVRDILNKTLSISLDSQLKKILEISSSLNDNFFAAESNLYKLGVNLLYMYKETDDEKNKIKLYFQNRKLI